MLAVAAALFVLPARRKGGARALPSASTLTLPSASGVRGRASMTSTCIASTCASSEASAAAASEGGEATRGEAARAGGAGVLTAGTGRAVT